MASINDIIKDAQDNRWSGELKIRFYFGEIKNVKISTTVNMEDPVDMNRYKQTRSDPYSKVVGQ